MAKNLTQKVFDKISRLKDRPQSGKRPQELTNLNYHEVIEGQYHIGLGAVLQVISGNFKPHL